jgi:signal transduction histidine kinase
VWHVRVIPARLRAFWRDLGIGTKGLIVIAIPVLQLALTTLVYFQFERVSEDGQAQSERVSENRQLAAQMYPLAVEAESAVRGYLLSGDRAQLDRSARARAAITRALASLDSHVDDRDMRGLLPPLRRLTMARLAELDAVLASNTTSGLTSPEMIVHLQRGAAVMDQLRAQADAIVRRNADVLAARRARERQLRTNTNVVVLVGAAGGVLFGILGALVFTQSITRRLSFATSNVLRLANNEPLVPAAAAADEIGVLKAATLRAGELLRQHEEALKQRVEQIEVVSRDLEAFSYSVSHDLRAPLRHVTGFASMLQKSAGPALSAEQRRYIQVIVDGAARMGLLIDDLLAFSRTSRTEMRREPVEMTALVRDVQAHLADDTNGRTIRWIVHPLPLVTGDAAMLRVVFDNLLSNAVKYTRPREEAEIEIGACPSPNGEAVLYVRDNGVGFDMQYEHKLFGVFQRLHSSDDFEGTGIGLATVRRIVARHGGRTWAEGRLAEGATFYVALPTTESHA